ncbi:MAG TPA: cytochrome P450 [Deltaproteobacteria bacterium]|nr:cytochrome P450 [Deltaproteobacteria bacterium]
MIGYDPYSDEVMRNPWPFYARLREEAPAFHLEKYDCWFLSRFEDIWQAAIRPDVFSAETGVSPGQILLREPPPPPTFTTMDMPRQREYRALINDTYKRGRVAKLEPRVRALTRELLDPLAEKGAFDVYRDLASPLAARVIGELIGLDREDADALREGIALFFGREPGQVGTSSEGAAAMEAMMERVARIVVARMEAPDEGGDDHLSTWVRARPEGRPMTVEEICGNVYVMMVTGSEVVPLAVANTILYLAAHPDQRRRVRREPQLIPAAFAESLRYDQPTNLLGRRLVQDVEMHGKTLRAGQGVMFLWASGNRDPREFERPDEFDIDRRPRRSLSYGHGIHKCVGEPLGKLEGHVLLEEILRAAPDYEICHAGVERTYGEFLHGHHRVPIEFDSGAAQDGSAG